MKESDWCLQNANFPPDFQLYVISVPYMEKEIPAIENMLVQ